MDSDGPSVMPLTSFLPEKPSTMGQWPARRLVAREGLVDPTAPHVAFLGLSTRCRWPSGDRRAHGLAVPLSIHELLGWVHWRRRLFFVISGFLITSLILADLRNETFSFYQFYARRIRRLLPAPLVTVVVMLSVATFVFAPDHLADAAKSGALATISPSNFYFAESASYFDSIVPGRSPSSTCGR